MIRHLAAPDRPVLRCESLQQLAVTYNPRLAADDFSPQSARTGFDQRFSEEEHTAPGLESNEAEFNP